MDEIQLDVQIRTETGRRNVKKMRQGDFVPAVVYGGAGTKKKSPTNIQINRRSYEKIMRTHAGQSVLFHLNVLEGDKNYVIMQRLSKRNNIIRYVMIYCTWIFYVFL